MAIKYAHNVLLAPLDWGLGHTTRCIPIIKELQQLQCNVFVACEGASKKLLEQEFNNLNFLPLKGYRIRYSKSKRGLPFKILQQLPKILLTIRYENNWLKNAISKHQIGVVISDNRYGLYNKKISCFFITHQLQVLAPYVWLQQYIQKVAYKFINKFNGCWVPDYEGVQKIAGVLSHSKHLPKIPVTYIGPLARFEKLQLNVTYKWLVLLSGPEPQRSILEKKLFAVLPQLPSKVLVVRGLPAATEQMKLSENCTVINHLNTQALQNAFAESEFIISRSGYTTVMEILALQKKSLLIPTPGQTEQEYLAKHLRQQRWAYTFSQNESDFLSQLHHAENFPYQLPLMPQNNVLTEVLKKALSLS